MSARRENELPGHAEIKAASKLHPSSGAWAFFMREVVRLPLELTPTVVQIIRIESWKLAADPLEAIRIEARQAHRRAWQGADSPMPLDVRGAPRNSKDTLL